MWENLDTIAPKDIPPRVIGASSVITGTGYFEYFLPLMSILGDIIDVHHRRFHPRLGMVDDTHAVAIIGDLLANCEASIDKLRQEIEMAEYAAPMPTPGAGPSIKDLISGYSNLPPPLPPQGPPAVPPHTTAAASRARDRSRLQLVAAYSTHILHVLHVLLHGKWDAISMLDDDDDWITSARFNSCASHAIAASQAVSQILKFDPELTFMPYLFGIYLLHGSFILLLFADRMPRVGPNQSVELACETIIRAHEVCVVTLSTEFQVGCAPPPRTVVSVWLGYSTLCLFCARYADMVILEKLPQGVTVDAVQRARVESHGVGGAQGQAQGSLLVSLDERGQRVGALIHSHLLDPTILCVHPRAHCVPIWWSRWNGSY